MILPLKFVFSGLRRGKAFCSIGPGINVVEKLKK